MGIRGRLLLLAFGVAVPLALVGAVGLRGLWNASRLQLDDSIQQQAELAAVAFERWVDAQRQPLTTLAAMIEEQKSLPAPTFADSMRFTTSTRPHWIDLHVVDAEGKSIASQPAGREPPPSALVDHLLSETRQRDDWVVVTDRTFSEERPLFAIAVPVRTGGAVIARVDGAVVSEVAIMVADTGCGILPEDIPHVFEKFYRGRPAAISTEASLEELPDYNEAPGVGLGLYLAHSIVEQLGGRITVGNATPRGTVFTIYLPVWPGNEGQDGRALEEEKQNVETIARS